MLDIFFIAAGALTLVLMLRLYCRCKKPILTGGINMLAGALSLSLSSLIASLLGVKIAVNLATAAVSVLLGVPGTVLVIIETVFI